MSFWQTGLALLGLLWALQAYGTWRQMRHYGRVMAEVMGEEADGFLGTGAARGMLSKGVVALIVAGHDGRTRRVMLMEGRSVLAKFRRAPEFEGLALVELATRDFPRAEQGRQAALRGAVAQIEKARLEKTPMGPQGTMTPEEAPAAALANPA